MMNNIALRQNEERFIEMLAAQRQLYSDHKRRMYMWLGVVAAFAVIGSLSIPVLKVPMAIGAVVLIVLEFFLMPRTDRLRTDAARIQELFDSEVLELPWNRTLTSRPLVEVIKTSAVKHLEGKKGKENRAELIEWYDSPDVPEHPLYRARIICQRENIWWDKTQRKKYADGMLILMLLLFILIVFFGFVPKFSLDSFNANVVLVSLPLIVLLIKHYMEHKAATTRLEELHIAVEALWNDSMDAVHDEERGEVERRSREIQTEIYHHRIANPPVLDEVYKRFKKQLESFSQTSGSFGGKTDETPTDAGK